VFQRVCLDRLPTQLLLMRPVQAALCVPSTAADIGRCFRVRHPHPTRAVLPTTQAGKEIQDMAMDVVSLSLSLCLFVCGGTANSNTCRSPLSLSHTGTAGPAAESERRRHEREKESAAPAAVRNTTHDATGRAKRGACPSHPYAGWCRCKSSQHTLCFSQAKPPPNAAPSRSKQCWVKSVKSSERSKGEETHKSHAPASPPVKEASTSEGSSTCHPNHHHQL
jgi:hypothetical protein